MSSWRRGASISLPCGETSARASKSISARAYARRRRTERQGTIDAELELASRRVRTVAPGGMAERAGLMVGDEIMAVDGVSVAELGAESTLALITQRPSGAVAKLSIVRGTEARNLLVTVRSEP